MGIIIIRLTDETEKKLRDYVTSKYPEPSVDKLSEAVETSVKEYLGNQKDGIRGNRVFY